MRILVTGAAGFIGSHITLEFFKRGYEVIAIDNFSRSNFYNFKFVREQGIEIIKGDIRDAVFLEKLPRVDWIIHAAALINVEESVEKPSLYYDINVRGTIILFKKFYEKGTRNFLYISSAAVYGEPKYLPVDEKHPVDPISPYGASKASAEFFIKSFYHSLSDFNYVIVRPFNVYGPGQSGEYAGVIARFIERILQGKSPIIFGDGLQTRDFIHVDDVARAIITIVEKNRLNEVFNIATGVPRRIRDLAYEIIKLANAQLEPTYLPPKPGDIVHSYAIPAKIMNLGWKPVIDFSEGLQDVLKWARSEIST
ncbi:MAG: epimerase [Thermoprotei archaeon]|nr:NAD-dependent epimerase/dehydratase family protein [Thermoproteales archaeon]RLE85239.1 MAG: epimerase [Thermoprotei archaeon]